MKVEKTRATNFNPVKFCPHGPRDPADNSLL